MSNNPIIILGAGGHAKVLAHALKLLNRRVLGFLTPDMEEGSEFCGEQVLGDDSEITKYSSNEVDLVNGLGSLPAKKLRWELAEKMRQQGYRFATVVHPTAVIASDVELEEGVQVMAGVVIQSQAKIGKDTIVNTGALIDHDSEVEKNCHIAPGVTCSGGVKIGANSHIGTGSIITEQRSIGNNCVIAAGSVVYKNVLNGARLIQRK